MIEISLIKNRCQIFLKKTGQLWGNNMLTSNSSTYYTSTLYTVLYIEPQL